MISPETTIGEMRALKDRYGFSGLPVVDDDENLVGIITNRDIRFVSDDSILVSEMMTTDLVTVPEHVDPEVAKKLLHQHRIENSWLSMKKEMRWNDDSPRYPAQSR